MISQASGALVVDGNSLSITEFGGPSYIQLLQAMLGIPGLTITNLAVGGKTTATMVANFSSAVVPLKSVGPVNLVLAMEGVNDIASGCNATQAFANTLQYCKLCRNAGFRVIVASGTPRNLTLGQEWFEANRIAYNDMLRKSWRNFADGFVDVGGHPVMGRLATYRDTTFVGDGTHWTPPGVAIVAQMFYPEVYAELERFTLGGNTGIWTPTLLNWTNTGTPTIQGTWRKENGLIAAQAIITPGTNVSALSGTSSVGNLPFEPSGNGAGVHFANDNQAVYLGTGVVWGGALWTPTINSTLRVSISATYPTSE